MTDDDVDDDDDDDDDNDTDHDDDDDTETRPSQIKSSGAGGMMSADSNIFPSRIS